MKMILGCLRALQSFTMFSLFEKDLEFIAPLLGAQNILIKVSSVQRKKSLVSKMLWNWRTKKKAIPDQVDFDF